MVQKMDERMSKTEERTMKMGERIGKMEVSVKKIEGQLDEIEAVLKKQVQPSPPEQVKAIALRSGKNLQEVHPTLTPNNVSDNVVSESVPKERVEEIPKESQPTPPTRVYYPPVPFPCCFAKK